MTKSISLRHWGSWYWYKEQKCVIIFIQASHCTVTESHTYKDSELAKRQPQESYCLWLTLSTKYVFWQYKEHKILNNVFLGQSYLVYIFITRFTEGQYQIRKRRIYYIPYQIIRTYRQSNRMNCRNNGEGVGQNRKYKKLQMPSFVCCCQCL